MNSDIINYTREIIFILDPAWNIHSVSPSVFQLLGFQHSELNNLCFNDFLYPDEAADKLNEKKLLQDSNLTKNSTTLKLRSATGQYVCFESIFTFIRDSKNEMETVVINSFKILESNVKENINKDVKCQVEFLSSHTQDVVSLLDLNADIVYVSAEVKRFSGYSPEELVGKSGFSHTHPDDIEKVKKQAFDVNLKGVPTTVEWRSRKKDNSFIWLETQFSLIFDKSGAPFQVLCISRDISDRKMAEKNLLESQQRYKSLFKYNPDAVFNLDLDGRFTDVNDAGLKLAQTTSENLIGSSFTEIAPPGEVEMYSKLFQQTKEGPVKGVTFETHDLKGQRLTLEFTNVPIIVNGKMLGISSITRDITEIKELQKEKELLYSISSHLDDEEKPLNYGINKALEEICLNVNSILGEIWFPDPGKKFMRLQNFYCKEDPDLKKFVRASDKIKLMAGEGVQGITWQNKQTTWHEDILNEPFFIRKKYAEAAGIKSCLSAPMMFKGECIAVTTLFFDFKKHEDDQIKDFMNIIPVHLAAEIMKRKSFDELNLFFEISSDLLCIAGMDGYYRKINKAFSKVLGHENEVLIENSIFKFIHPQDLEITKQEILGLEKGEPVQNFENRMICSDGGYKWIEWTAQALPDQDVFFCIGRDISYQKAKEEELLRIKFAVEGTNDAIAIVDHNRRPIYHNKAFIDLIGYTPEDLIHTGGPSVLYADHRQFDKIKKEIDKGKAFQGDVQLINRKKEKIDFNIRANIIYDSKKLDIGLVVIFTDISERIKMQKKIQYEKYFAESIINALPGIFYMIDNQGKFRRWNTNFLIQTGYSEKEIVNMSPVELFPQEEQNSVSLKIKEVFDIGEAYVESTLLSKGGKETPYYFTGILTEVKKEKFLLGFGIDITERKTAQKQLEEANQKLARRAQELVTSNEELVNFAYIASHDLQEPLRMITGFLQLLQDKYNNNLDEDGKQYIRYVLTGAERMKALILDLLEYSKVGTNIAVISEVDMNEVMDGLRNIYQEKIQENNVQLIYDDLPRVRGVKIQIIQLFQNLIGNAIKYRSKQDPIIEISCKEQERKWLFSIRDNGIGIPEKYGEKVFVIFKRLHNRKEYTGTGLGLAICKKIVERHGGKIWVQPNANQGSNFCFTILK